MKKYIFLTNTIGSVGGSQLYISRKTEYLRKYGWEIEVFYSDKEEITIDNLKVFSLNHLQILSVPFELVSEKQKRKVLRRFVPNKHTVIESHLVGYSLWGEYIANHIGAKHIAYFLCEQFPPLSDRMADFLKFKLKQNLLYGISPKSIPALLREDIDGTPYRLYAVGGHSSVGGVDSRIEQLPEADYTILSLGRLDKPYIPSMIEAVREFAEIYEEKNINLLVIGDSPFREKLIEPLKSRNNVHILTLGELTPIPRNAFLASDVAIATSGCVTLTSQNDVPTIAVDGNDFYAIGIKGYTTSNTLFRNSDEPQLNIKDLLEDVLVKEMYPKKGVLKSEEEELDYSAHQTVIDLKFDCQYYELEKIDKSKSFTLETLVARCFGWRMYLKYMKLKFVIKKKLKWNR